MSNQRSRTIVLGHIDQIHFVSTEIDTCFTVPVTGGEVGNRKLLNTCPIDGPLLWLMHFAYSFRKIKEFMDKYLDNGIKIAYDLVHKNKISEAKLH